jgi:predicted RNase H-like HicB family nuclease
MARRRTAAAPDEMRLRLRIRALKEGGYLATSPDVPGLVAEGRSLTEVANIARGVALAIVESCLEHGDPLPLSRVRFPLVV